MKTLSITCTLLSEAIVPNLHVQATRDVFAILDRGLRQYFITISSDNEFEVQRALGLIKSELRVEHSSVMFYASGDIDVANGCDANYLQGHLFTYFRNLGFCAGTVSISVTEKINGI